MTCNFVVVVFCFQDDFEDFVTSVTDSLYKTIIFLVFDEMVSKVVFCGLVLCYEPHFSCSAASASRLLRSTRDQRYFGVNRDNNDPVAEIKTGRFERLHDFFLLFADIDECLKPGACGSNALCINTVGNHTCQCQEGFTGNPYNGVCYTLFSLSMCTQYVRLA